jgi:molybdopterin-guanine dinucleotide biosynthesis protein A
MGTDKALTTFNGIPLIQHALQILASAGLQTRIAGSRSPLNHFAEEIPDTFPESGPLGGIHAALSASPAEWNVFLPVDLPLMPSSLLSYLLQRAVLTGASLSLCKLNGRLQPFPVVLNQKVLPFIEQRLQASQTACHAAWKSIPEILHSTLDSVAVEHLVQCGQCAHPLGLPQLFWFQSANTLAELAWLEQMSSGLRTILK